MVPAVTDDREGAREGVLLGLVVGTVDVECLRSLALDMEESSEFGHLDVGRACFATVLCAAVGWEAELGQNMGQLDLSLRALATGVDRHVRTGNAMVLEGRVPQNQSQEASRRS